MQYKTSKQKQDKKETHSTLFRSPLTIWWFWQSLVLEIGKNTNMAFMISVEYILAQGKISAIGIKSLSGNDKK